MYACTGASPSPLGICGFPPDSNLGSAIEAPLPPLPPRFALMPAFDPFDPVVLADPYPAYAEIREADGLTHLPLLDAWLVSRHEDVVAVLRQGRLYSSARGMGDLVAMAFTSE